MTGREENNIKIESNINNILKDMPLFAKEWYITLRASNKEYSTCRDFLTKLRNFLRFINPNISEIKPEDINDTNTTEYFLSIQYKIKNGEKVHTSDSFQQTNWCCLKNFMDFMNKKKYIPENYITVYVNKPKNKDLDRINENRILLTEEDFNSIISTVKKGIGYNTEKRHRNMYMSRDMSIVLLFMTTGMRKTALSEINIEDVDFENKTLHVIDKGRKNHIYYLSDDLIYYLKKWLKVRAKKNPNTNALFISKKGTRITGGSLYNLIEKYCIHALGYNVSPHKIRSGFCSIMYNKTGDIEKVRRMVGHSNVSTTQRYIVTKNAERIESMDIMSSLLSV